MKRLPIWRRRRRRRLQRSDCDFLLVRLTDDTLGICESERLLAALDPAGNAGLIAQDLAEPLPVVTLEATLREALQAMVRGRVGHVAVMVPGEELPRVLGGRDLELVMADSPSAE